MSEPTLAPAVRDLLAAVLEAIDLPHPATVGDTDAHHALLADRAMDAVVALQCVLHRSDCAEWSADYLRGRLAEKPVTGYVTVDQAHAALDAGKSWSEAVTLSTGEDQ